MSLFNKISKKEITLDLKFLIDIGIKNQRGTIITVPRCFYLLSV